MSHFLLILRLKEFQSVHPNFQVSIINNKSEMQQNHVLTPTKSNQRQVQTTEKKLANNGYDNGPFFLRKLKAMRKTVI